MRLGTPSFADKALLIRALTHYSQREEGGISLFGDYHVLEKIGDSILALAVAYDFDMHVADKARTSALSSLVRSNVFLGAIGHKLGVLDLSMMGPRFKKELLAHESDSLRVSIAADLIESLIGGIFLDGGLDAAIGFVRAKIWPVVRAIPETQLQEIMRKGKEKRYGTRATQVKSALAKAGFPGAEIKLTVSIDLGGGQIFTGIAKSGGDLKPAFVEAGQSAFAFIRAGKHRNP